MVVKFALLPKQWERPRRKKKVVAVGPLLGSKTYEDKSPGILLQDRDPFLFVPEDEQDNLSALELALNNTDTQVVASTDPTQRPSRNLLRYLRKPKVPEESRDDVALPRHPSLGSLSPTSSAPTKQTSSYLITLTPLSLTGLTPSAALVIPATASNKVKVYVRVVRKVSGMQMLPDTPRLLKSQRLSGGSTVSWPPDAALHMQSTPQYHHQGLCLEVGLVTPDGLAPLGTATLAPIVDSTSAVQRVVPVERLAARLRPTLFLGRKKAPVAEAPYRLTRHAALTVSYTVQTVATTTASNETNKEMIPVASLTRAASTPAPETIPDATDELQPMPAAPLGMLTYLSDPLSCCSGDNDTFATVVEDDDDDDKVVEVASPEPAAEVSSPLQERRDIVFEDPTLFQDSVPHSTGEDYWCCGWFPMCCGGTSNAKSAIEEDKTVKAEEEEGGGTRDVRVVSMVEEEDAPVLAEEEEKEETAVVIKKPPKLVKEKEMKLNTARLDLVPSLAGDEMSQPEHPNCFMSCLGDEDVENLKYAYMSADDPRIPSVIEPEMHQAPSAGAISHGESNIHEDITVPASGGKNDIRTPPHYDYRRSQSQLERVLDTKSSSISAENGDDEENSNYYTSFSETLLHEEEEEETGCFPCLAVMSSEGEMSSSFSQYDSLSGMTQSEQKKKSKTNQEIHIVPELDRDI